MNKTFLITAVLCLPFFFACGQNKLGKPAPKKNTALTYNLAAYPKATTRVSMTNAEWKKKLSPEQYRVMREKGTERAFTGKYADSKEKGIYVCAACNNPLFSSDTKFDSGTGWPSFYSPIEKARVAEATDTELGMSRTEVLCARCHGHLGHVFDDGPEPTGLRYCMNSAALRLDKK